MSPERSKFLWITIAASAFVLVVAIAGVFLFYPKNRAPAAPATVGNTAAPKPPDPQDYLNAPATAPTETKRNGDVIVIYGDKPQAVPPLGGTANSPGAANQDATTGQGTQAAPGTTSVPAVTTTTTTTTSIPPIGANPSYGSDWNNQPSTPSAPPAPSTQSTPVPPSTSDLTQPSPSPRAAKSVAPAPRAKAPVAARPAAKAKAVATKSTSTATSTKKAAAQRVETSYWIQTASFTERDKADNLRGTLASKGLTALIAVKDINAKSWYRVRLGPYPSGKEATLWLAKVKLVKGCDEAYVTSETMKQ